MVVGKLEYGQEGSSGISLVEAVNQALRYELEHDERVLVLGEDIGVNGGVFRATEGLLALFGEDRVIDTPLAEAGIAGVAIGMAVAGLRPIAEIQFMGFMPPIFDQILSHASRMRNRTRGRLSCPLVVRAPYGGGVHAPEHHSESTEAILAHMPGLRVVIPSTPRRAYGLLLAAIRDPDPVIFLEPKRIYRSFKEEVVDDGKALPLDTAFVEREGDDVTIVSWGASMKEVREVAEILSKEGINVEVIDVATLGSTFDYKTIIASVAKTGRCVIVHEAPLTGGFGAEIIARIAEHAILSLLAVKRVCGYDTVMPYFRLENYYLPSVKRIVDGVKEVMEYT